MTADGFSMAKELKVTIRMNGRKSARIRKVNLPKKLSSVKISPLRLECLSPKKAFLNISHKTYFCSSGDRAFRLLLLRTVFTSWSIGSMMGHNRSPGYLQTHLSLRCRIFNISEILPASQTCISLYHVDDRIQYKITWTNVKTQTRKHFKTLRTQPLISPKRL